MFAVQIFLVFVAGYLDNCFGNTAVLLVAELTALVNESELIADYTDDGFLVAVGIVAELVELACVVGCSADCTDIVAWVVLHNQLKIFKNLIHIFLIIQLIFPLTLITCRFLSFLLLWCGDLNLSGLISVVVQSSLFGLLFVLSAALKPIRYNVLNGVVGFGHGFWILLLLLNLVFAFYLY